MGAWSKTHGGHRVFLALHSSFPHQTSGYAVRSHSIATHLLAHGVDLSVYTRPGFPNGTEGKCPPMQDEVEGVLYHRLPQPAPEIGLGGPFYRDMARAAYATAIKATGASIVHAASDMENGWPAVMAGKDRGARTIYEYRGMWHYTRSSRVPWFPTTEEFAERHALELQVGMEADAVLTISEALRDDLVSQGLDEAKIRILPNAVDVARFSPLPPDERLRDELNLKGRKVVGFVGSVTAYEGLELLMDAVLSLNASGEKVTLLIVGEGVHIARLKELHAAREGHACILFAGHVPYEDIQRYYSIIDIIALPRIDAKVCQCVPPLKPLEAMAMGKALIVSDVAALREMVRHDETGLVCRADSVSSLVEQLGRLVGDASLYRRLTENALDWVRQERDWAYVSKRILRVYESLIG